MEGQRKFFHDKIRTKEVMDIKPAPQKVCEGPLQTEEKDKHIPKATGKNKPHYNRS